PATIIAVSLAALGPAALAQSSEEDPAKRAMERIEAAVGGRAVTADRALAASKLVNESAEARKRGDPQQAIESLEKAEKIATESGSLERSALIDELLRLVAKERAALSPGPAPYAAGEPGVNQCDTKTRARQIPRVPRTARTHSDRGESPRRIAGRGPGRERLQPAGDLAQRRARRLAVLARDGRTLRIVGQRH